MQNIPKRRRGLLAEGSAAAPANNKKESDMSDEIVRPANLRANVIPVDGFVLSIDGKLKTRYETAQEAMAAGTKLKQSFPVVQIQVFDAAARTYAPLEPQQDQ
jgi:hypothetical protein